MSNPLFPSEFRTAFPIGRFIFAQDEGEQHNGMRATSGFLRYDTHNDSWTQFTMPAKLDTKGQHGYEGGSMTGDGKNAFLVGGRRGHSGQSSNLAFRYDVADKAWKQLPDMHEGRTEAAVAAHDGKLFALGGISKGYGAGASTVLASAEMYDPATNAWTKLPDMPNPRQRGRAVIVGDKLLVIGGASETHWNKTQHAVDVLDLNTLQWQAGFKLPTAATHPSVWVDADDQVHVSGGRTPANTHTGTVNSIHEVLDPATGAVRDARDLPAPEHATGMMAVEVEGRTFAMSAAAYGKEGSSRMWELAEAEPRGQDVLAIVHQNLNVDVDIHKTVQNVTNLVDIDIHQTTKNFQVVHQEKNIEVNVLPVLQQASRSGFFGDGFFLQTLAGTKPLVQMGTDDEGARHLLGRSQGNSRPAPKSRELVLFHPESGTAVPFQTDTKGQFDVRLPDGLKGTVVIFDPAQTGPIGGASLELP